jgi:cell wall-associated NlpC family hydrolase
VVPSALVTALAAPLLELQTTVGSGVFTGDDPARVLDEASGILTDLAAAGSAALGDVGAAWSGVAANAASQAISTALTAAGDAAARASMMAGRVGAASDAVTRAKTELQRIIDEFQATAAALEGDLPRSAPALADAARQALGKAAGVVDELQAELDGHAAAVAQPVPAQPSATLPTGMTSSALPALAGMSSAVPGIASGLLGAASPLADIASADHEALITPDALGNGVTVHLPDGSTVMAPNTIAADAVRHALTQLGVPYDWGGTTPGVGLDCSGLTQWAYHEAGLNLPRLAQEQDIGAAVSQNALLPGDLAVWDGHVAMIVGDGMMIEAGDPVQLSPIRMTNAGQGFQGFWRPTA